MRLRELEKFVQSHTAKQGCDTALAMSSTPGCLRVLPTPSTFFWHHRRGCFDPPHWLTHCLMGTGTNADNIKVLLWKIFVLHMKAGKWSRKGSWALWVTACREHSRTPQKTMNLGLSSQRPGREGDRGEVCLQQQDYGDGDGETSLTHRCPKQSLPCLPQSTHMQTHPNLSCRALGLPWNIPRRACWIFGCMNGTSPWFWEVCALFWHHLNGPLWSPGWESMKWDHLFGHFVRR